MHREFFVHEAHRRRQASGAGSANNQLDTREDGEKLRARGILSAPDFVINAGGVIALSVEGSPYTGSELTMKLDGIGVTLSKIFARARMENRPESAIADEIARDRIRSEKCRKQAA